MSVREVGLVALWGMRQWLGREPLDCHETGHWLRRHEEDRYE